MSAAVTPIRPSAEAKIHMRNVRFHHDVESL